MSKSKNTNLNPFKDLDINPVPKVILRKSVLNSKGKIGWAILWLLGVPLPVLFFFFLLRGCT